MDVNHPYSGANIDWGFPSPTATPTTASFSQHTFQTPKPITPSNFQDAHTTPQIPAFPTPQPMQYPAIAPVRRPHTAAGDNNIEAFEPLRQGLIVPSNGYQSAAVVGSNYPAIQQSSVQLAMNASFDGSQMQTPPPTRGGLVKRMSQPQAVAFGTPSTIASRRFATPQQCSLQQGYGNQRAQATPVQFPQLQFSPDVGNIGPASAPVIPHGRILWDQSNSSMATLPSTTLDDPFSPDPPGWSFQSAAQPSSQAMSFDTPAMNSFSISSLPGPRSSVPSQPQTLPDGVDPALLYSSPLQTNIQPVSRKNGGGLHRNAPDILKPANDVSYSGLLSSQSVARPSKASRPALTRSVTADGAYKQSVPCMFNATESFLSADSTRLTSVRATSPLKRVRSSPLQAIAETKPNQRRSVILTIDENGRARTETRQQDDSSTCAMRERYPALFDSDSSEDEASSEDTHITQSRTTSSILDPRDENERRLKAAKLDPPIEDLAGLVIPRTGSSASMRKIGIPPSKAAIAAVAQLRRNSSMRKASSTIRTRRSPLIGPSSSFVNLSPVDASDAHSQASETMLLPRQGESNPWSLGPNGPAALARPSSQPQNVERELEAHNRRWSFMSFEQHKPSQPQLQSQTQAAPQTAPPSHLHQSTAQRQPQAQMSQPLQGNLETYQQLQAQLIPLHNHFQSSLPPNTAFEPSSAPFFGQSQIHPTPQQQLPIRCSCAIPTNDGRALIQCRSCTQWLHASCVSNIFNGQIPQNFTCFLCTKPLHAMIDPNIPDQPTMSMAVPTFRALQHNQHQQVFGPSRISSFEQCLGRT